MEDRQIPEDDQAGQAVPGAEGLNAPSQPADSPAPEGADKDAAPESEAPQGIFRWKAIIVLAVLFVLGAVFNALYLDTAIRKQFPSVGEMVISARTEIGTVTVSTTRLALSARHFDLVDPENIATSMVTADAFECSVDPIALLTKKLHVQTLTLEGLRWDEPRSPEAVARHRELLADREAAEKQAEVPAAEETQDEEENAGSMPDFGALFERLSSKVAISRDDLQTTALVKALQADTEAMVTRGTGQLADLGIADRTRDASAALETCAYIPKLTSKELRDPLIIKKAREDLARLDKSMQNLKQAGIALQALTADLKRDLAVLQTRAGTFKTECDADKAMLRERFGDEAFSAAEISRVLFGERIGGMLGTYGPLFTKITGLFPDKAEKKAAAAVTAALVRGITVEFSRPGDLPAVLIDEIAFSGEKNGIRITGRATGITSNPRLYGKPTIVELTCSDPALTVKAVIDRTQGVRNDAYTIDLSGLEARCLAPPHGTLFPFDVTGGTVRLHAEYVLADGTSRYALDLAFQGIRLEGTPANDIQRILKQCIEKTPDVTLTVRSNEQGRPQIESDIDDLFNREAREELAALLAQKRQEAEAQLQAILGEYSAALVQILNGPQAGLTARLDQELAAVNQVKDAAEKTRKDFEAGQNQAADELEAEKKKAEEELQKKLDAEKKKAEEDLKKKAGDTLKNLLKKP